MQKQNNSTHSFPEPTLEHKRSVSACVSDVGNHKEQCSDLSSGSKAQESGSGAPPSNTAPVNYIDSEKETKILRYGIDSLYLSYQGSLARSLEEQLEGLKLAAQSLDEAEKASAQIEIGDHLFEVMGRGVQRFPFVLKNNCFHIQLSRHSSDGLPLAYVQLASELLTFVSIEDIIKEVNFIINSCGLVKGKPQVSRVDLFTDFTSSWDMCGWRDVDWITRAHKINRYSIQRRFSGWAIGQGASISARLYDKTLELQKSKKEYLKQLWEQSGWNGLDSVWRLEFQLKREVLSELSVFDIDGLLSHLSGLWGYCSRDWLRLTIPKLGDSNQTRWDTHPLWCDLQEVKFSTQPNIPLKRVRKERIPADESLFINGMGGITSFMARNGITDLGEGFKAFLAHAKAFHEFKGRQTGTGLSQYVKTKVKAKGRKYNTIDNRKDLPDPKIEAKAYRKAKDGEL